MPPKATKLSPLRWGLSNDSYVQITSGLNEGDIVYVAASTEENRMMMPGMGGMPMGGGMPGGGMNGGGMNGRMSGGGMAGGNMGNRR